MSLEPRWGACFPSSKPFHFPSESKDPAAAGVAGPPGPPAPLWPPPLWTDESVTSPRLLLEMKILGQRLPYHQCRGCSTGKGQGMWRPRPRRKKPQEESRARKITEGETGNQPGGWGNSCKGKTEGGGVIYIFLNSQWKVTKKCEKRWKVTKASKNFLKWKEKVIERLKCNPSIPHSVLCICLKK